VEAAPHEPVLVVRHGHAGGGKGGTMLVEMISTRRTVSALGSFQRNLRLPSCRIIFSRALSTPAR
jgi:hypothetical protein